MFSSTSIDRDACRRTLPLIVDFCLQHTQPFQSTFVDIHTERVKC